MYIIVGNSIDGYEIGHYSPNGSFQRVFRTETYAAALLAANDLNKSFFGTLD